MRHLQPDTSPGFFVGPSLVIPDPLTGIARVWVAVPMTDESGPIDEVVHQEDDNAVYDAIENMTHTGGSGGLDITPGEVGVDRGVGFNYDRRCEW
ncbi:MAG: hypothetical protein ABIR32_07175 [Ilumatobacteraceae bacterium]